MANPITWRTIGMPDFGSSNKLGIQAGNQITSGIDAISKAAGDFRQNQIANEDAIKAANTQNFMRQIQGFNNLDGYDSFQQRMQQELGQFNPAQVDFNQVNTALEGRDNTLRTDVQEQQAFDTGQTKRRDSQIFASKYIPNVINKSTDIGDAFKNLDALIKSEEITDPTVIAEAEASLREDWTNRTKLTQRQIDDRESSQTLAQTRFEAEAADAEMDYRNQLPLEEGEYESFYNFESTPQEFIKANYQGTDGLTAEEGEGGLLGFFGGDHDGKLNDDIKSVQDTYLSPDKVLSNKLSKSERALWTEAQRMISADGGLKKDVLNAAFMNTLKETMGARKADFNSGTHFQNVYKKNLLEAIRLKKGKQKGDKITTGYNAFTKSEADRFAEELMLLNQRANQQNIPMFR